MNLKTKSRGNMAEKEGVRERPMDAEESTEGPVDHPDGVSLKNSSEKHQCRAESGVCSTPAQ